MSKEIVSSREILRVLETSSDLHMLYAAVTKLFEELNLETLLTLKTESF
jgi:hypothetical protein